MSQARKVAQAFNRWAKGLDTMGGADGMALEEMLSEYLCQPGSGMQPQECKLSSLINKTITIIILGDDEDFDAHYEGNEDGKIL